MSTQNLVVFCHFGLRKDDAFCRAIAKHCLKLQELVLELDGPLDAATLAALVQLPRLRTLQLQGAVCDDAGLDAAAKAKFARVAKSRDHGWWMNAS